MLPGDIYGIKLIDRHLFNMCSISCSSIYLLLKLLLIYSSVFVFPSSSSPPLLFSPLLCSPPLSSALLRFPPLSCALLCSPLLSSALLCSPVLSSALLCSPLLSSSLLCSPLLSSLCSPPSALLRLLSSVCSPPSALLSLPSALCSLLSALCSLLSSLLSPLCSLLSPLCSLLSALCSLLSPLSSLLSPLCLSPLSSLLSPLSWTDFSKHAAVSKIPQYRTIRAENWLSRSQRFQSWLLFSDVSAGGRQLLRWVKLWNRHVRGKVPALKFQGSLVGLRLAGDDAW